jgi:hypothetical protein
MLAQTNATENRAFIFDIDKHHKLHQTIRRIRGERKKLANRWIQTIKLTRNIDERLGTDPSIYLPKRSNRLRKKKKAPTAPLMKRNNKKSAYQPFNTETFHYNMQRIINNSINEQDPSEATHHYCYTKRHQATPTFINRIRQN